MIIIEFGPPWQRPGKYSTTFLTGHKYKRIWFGLIAVTWTEMNQTEYHDYIAEGNTTWVGGNE